uniref:DUF3108 domain-containing protein n=1 Tax=uncultured Thiotrichaceae bacterium TaxID=298394 RepID=A0A6S6UK60_9GAMM|nr:MAG: Unknown protein [uncultured Thiotrichaceae bacterium]
MKNTFKKLILLSTLLTSQGLLAAPQAFQASYAVMKSGLSLGEMNANLVYSGSNYTYLKQTKANGIAALLSGDMLTERSSGTQRGGLLNTQQYLHHHKNKRKERRDQFNFATPTQAKGQYKNANYSLTVPNGTLDPALLELRIMDDLKANRPLNYKVTEKGKLKDYRFQRQGKETLSLPAGKYLCEKILMIRDNGERITTIWLAPELNYVPVQIRHNEKGSIIETKLKSYTAR